MHLLLQFSKQLRLMDGLMPLSVPVLGKKSDHDSIAGSLSAGAALLPSNSVSKPSAGMTAAAVFPVQGHGHRHWWGHAAARQ